MSDMTILARAIRDCVEKRDPRYHGYRCKAGQLKFWQAVAATRSIAKSRGARGIRATDGHVRNCLSLGSLPFALSLWNCVSALSRPSEIVEC